MSPLAVLVVALLAFNMRTAIAEIPPVLPDLGLTAAAGSVLVTLPVLCFGVAALAAPTLRTRMGEERVLIAVLATLLAGVLLRAAWPDSPGLFTGTVLVGCAIAVMNVLMPSYVRRRFAAHAGLMTGVYTTSLVAGASLAAGVTVPLYDATGESLRVALGIWALPVALALLAWLPQRRHRVSRAAMAAAGATRLLWRDRVAWGVTLFMGLQSLLYFAALSWLPAIHRDQGIDPATAGVLLALMNLLNMPGALLAPTLADRMSDQRVPAAGAALLALVAYMGLALGPSDLALLWVVLLGLAQGAGLGLGLLLIVLRAPDDDTAARLSSMAQGVGYLLAAAGPLVVGLLHAATGAWTVPLACLVAIAVLQLASGLAAGRARTVASGA